MSSPAKRGYLVGVAVALCLAIYLLAALSFPRPAHACSCASSGSPAEALAEADAVFAGEVVAVRPLGHPPFRMSTADPVAVEFKVSRVWKGPRRETLIVETESSGISCGYEFKKGRKYIVYTWDGTRTGLCTRTAPAWMAFADFVALGPGHSPEVLPGAEMAGGGACGAATGSSERPLDIASVILLAGVIALGIRRRPRL